MKPHMHLCFDVSWAHMEGRWRMPGSWTGRNFPDLAVYEEIARIAERGLIDMLFCGDGSGVPATWKGSYEESVRWGIGWPRQDMAPWIAALSRCTTHLGFGLTYASTFMHPYYTARLLNSLDHVTGGRIAFNVITSTRRADAANFGFDELMEHNSRYERLEEFVAVCRALWDSVEPDAMLWDRETGHVADPSKVHAIDHDGRFFKVRGPINTAPSPQHHPIIIQAGGSPRGLRASAKVADHVFAANKPLPEKIRHRKLLDDALVEEGRDPSQVGMIWDVILVVGETEAEAKAHRDMMLTQIPPEASAVWVSYQAGYDFSTLPARFTLHELNEQVAATQASPVGFVHELAHVLGEHTEITREEFLEHCVLEATGFRNTIAGSAAQVADWMEETFEETGNRGGFMIAHPPASPRDFLNVVDFLVPELQRRGRFRRAYAGKTLRENMAM